MKQQDLFEKIDEYFKNKKQSEIFLVAIAIAAAIGFIVYLYVFPMAKKYLNTSINNNQNITQMLFDETNYIKGIENSNMIGDLNMQIQQITNNLKETKQTNIYINKKLQELSYLLFDNENWAKFLDNISVLAQKNNITILKISNKINELNKNKVEQILNVHVKFKGEFKDIIKMINKLEESMLIVDIYDIALDAKEKIQGSLDIAVWGIVY